MRLLGLDFGDKTVGVAVSDPTGLIAQRVEIIRRPRPGQLRSTYRRIGELLQRYDAAGIVLGCPFNMDGTAGERVEKTLAFKKELEKKFGLPVWLSDERLTTVEADAIMDEVGIAAADRKKYVDQIAAEIILQEYLDENRTDPVS